MKLAVSMLLAVSLLVWPSTGFAQTSDEERAVELFQQSVEHYNAGRFTVAAALLREALELHPNEPTLQYNLARALESEGDLTGAIEAYETLLDGGAELEDRGAIEERLNTLRRQRDLLEAREAADPDPDPEPDPDRDAEPEPDSEPDIEPDIEARTMPLREPSAAPWITMGVGVALLGVGAALGTLAVRRNNDALEEPVHEEAVDLRDQAEGFQLMANINFVTGGVIAGLALIWGIVDVRKSHSDNVQLGFGPGHVAVRGSF